MKSLGLDLSLAETGFCVTDENGVLSSGTIKTNKKTFAGDGELARRVGFIRKGVLQIVEQFSPDVIVIEGYAIGGRGRVFDLAELGGSVKHALFDYRVNGYRGLMYICPPTTLKKAFTGKGNAKKPDMSKAQAKFGESFDNDNVVDALFLSLAGLVTQGEIFKGQAWGHTQMLLPLAMELYCSRVTPRIRV